SARSHWHTLSLRFRADGWPTRLDLERFLLESFYGGPHSRWRPEPPGATPLSWHSGFCLVREKRARFPARHEALLNGFHLASAEERTASFLWERGSAALWRLHSRLP